MRTNIINGEVCLSVFAFSLLNRWNDFDAIWQDFICTLMKNVGNQKKHHRAAIPVRSWVML